MARIDSFLSLVVEQRASDLHFHSGLKPTIRYLGDLIEIPFRTLTAQEAELFLFEMMTEEQKSELAREKSVDFAYVLDEHARFRANVFRQSRGIGAVFRVIPERGATLDKLGFPPAVVDLCSLNAGLVLITGPTGSGKTTTMTAMIKEINRTSHRHIITIEDPIEYIHQPTQGLITQRELGKHTKSTAMALRAALREAPDVLVVGELRDYETISLALSAAETGVLVLGTLHTNSAAKAVDRLIGASPAEEQEQTAAIVSSLLKGTIAQHLVKLASGDGRVAVVEVLLQSYAVAHLIRENKCYQIDAYLKSGECAGTGMQSLDTHILEYVRDGLITLEDGLTVANDPDALQEAAKELQGAPITTR